MQDMHFISCEATNAAGTGGGRELMDHLPYGQSDPIRQDSLLIEVAKVSRC